jgi:succinate--hydroxymethylglutarate CoA-transferase
MSLSLAARSLRSRSVNGCARGLPLEGIRVLDMTRVLAGVSLFVLVTVLIEKY